MLKDFVDLRRSYTGLRIDAEANIRSSCDERSMSLNERDDLRLATDHTEQPSWKQPKRYMHFIC